MKITITLDSLDENLIQFYESSETHKIKDALYHGFQIVNSKQYALNLYQQEETHTHLLQDLEKLKHEKQLSQQKHQIELEEQAQEFRSQKNQLKIQLSEIQNQQFQVRLEVEKQIKLDTENTIHKLEHKNEELQLEKDKLNQQFLQFHQDTQNKLESLNLQHKLEVDTYQQKLEEHNSIFSNSSKKGQFGEVRMLDTLNELFPQAEIYDTHKTTANGDFRIIIHGIQILYENKNFQNNVPKRDIEKFKRDIEISDCDCGIMCSENSGISNREDLDLEILGEAQKPAIYLHRTNSNLDKIRIAILILVKILENKLDLNTSTLLDIKNQVKDCEAMLTIYQTNRKQITGLQENNEQLAIHCRRIKYKLEYIIQELSQNSQKPKKIKAKCEYCGKAYADLNKHYLKCEKN